MARCYSLCSSPVTGEPPTVTIKRTRMVDASLLNEGDLEAGFVVACLLLPDGENDNIVVVF